MALIVYTEGISTEAESYISLVDAQAMLDARDLNVTLTEGLLVRSMDWLNTLNYCPDALALTETPQGIINAQVWLSYYISEGTDPAAISTQPVKREKVDVLEVEYQDSQGANTTVSIYDMPNVKSNLEGLICMNSGYIGRA